MSNVWNGSALQTRWSQKHGLTDTTNLARILEWINDIQEDVCSAYNWPFLKMKIKKQVTSSEQEVDISPQIPSAPTSIIASGGSLTDGSTYSVKTTFLIYDESLKEENSIESEPSTATAVVTGTAVNKTVSLTNIDTYDGSTSVRPTTIYRRVYLSKDSGNFYLYSTITDNTTTTLSITAETTSLVEPPEQSMVNIMANEDPLIEASGQVIYKESLDRIKQFDPQTTSSGTPYCYARISPTKILLYPKPSATITLSYYVFKRAARVFADTSRAIQMPSRLKLVLEAGVTWKSYEYKDQDGQESKATNYAQLKQLAIQQFKKVGGKFGTIRDTEGDWEGIEI